jgi:integrase
LPDGQRRFKSTKQRSRKEALKVCLGWEKAVDAAGRGELSQSQARKILDEILENIGEGPIRRKTVSEFFSKWLEGKQLAKKQTTGKRYKKTVDEFLASLGDRANKSIASITPADIECFRDTRTRQGVSASTVKLDLKLIRSVFNTARRQALIVHNPAEAIDLPLAKSQERWVFTPADMRALLNVAPKDWKTAILLGYYAGPRLGDVVSLTWDSVDLAESVLFYRQGKTGKKVEVPIHPDLEEHLLLIAGDAPRGFLCGHLATAKIGGRSGLSKQFAAIMAKAGIDQRQVQSSKNRKFSQLSFHSFRHSFNSALANASVSPDVRMKLTGHQSIDVDQRYTHVELEPLKKAIAQLPRLAPAQTKANSYAEPKSQRGHESGQAYRGSTTRQGCS